MKPKGKGDELLSCLIRAARRVEAPPFFAVRVAARAFQTPRPSVLTLLEGLAHRLVPVLATVAAVSVALALWFDEPDHAAGFSLLTEDAAAEQRIAQDYWDFWGSFGVPDPAERSLENAD
jgi:hypothetical protein